MPEVVPGFLGGVSLTVSGLSALLSGARKLIETHKVLLSSFISFPMFLIMMIVIIVILIW